VTALGPEPWPGNLEELDLSDPALYGQGFPHALFARLRADAPVWWHPRTPGVASFRDSGFWVLSGYHDIHAVSRDPSRFSSRLGGGLLDTRPERRGHAIVTMDPPDHSRLRRLVSLGFTPRTTDELASRMHGHMTVALDAIAEDGACDFVSTIAYVLPMQVIADMVGIPDAERPWVFNEVATMLKALDRESDVPAAEWDAAGDRLTSYSRVLAGQRSTEPADDVWSTLVHATLPAVDGSAAPLSQVELDVWFLTLAMAGSETTRNAAALGMLALLQHGDQLEALRADRALVPSAVEEILRWSSPVVYHRRTVTADVEVGGQQLRAGEPVTMWWPSANRDADVFSDPFRFDIRRRPNEHVAFGGGGPHYCLGANLAKRELRCLFEAVLDRLDDIELAGPVTWAVPGLPVSIGLGVERLPIRFRAR